MIENSFSKEMSFEAGILTYDKNLNILIGENRVIIKDGQGLTITADRFQYNKTLLIFDLTGDIKLIDKKNKIKIITEKLSYDENKDIILSNTFTSTEIENNYLIKTNNLEYFRNESKITSNKESYLKDNLNNTVKIKEFNYDISNKNIKAKKINLTDYDNSNYLINDVIIDLKLNQITGQDFIIKLAPNSLKDTSNEPTIIGETINLYNDKTIIKKATFTTCKKTDKCPPWVLTAKEIEHDKIKKRINYKNAWFTLYDVPVAYFPSFYHPDPSVKRQSGFLTPKITNSNNLGNILTIPYYHVISDNRDFTFSPKFYDNTNILLQTEYRQVNNKSDHIIDSSVLSNDKFALGAKEIKGHFFSNSKYKFDIDNFDDANLEINLQQSSEKNYLKSENIKSELLKNNQTLNSYLNFEATRDDFYLHTSIEVFEKLDAGNSDRYEFIYPNISIVKNLDIIDQFEGETILESSLYQKKYNTNVYEAVVINDLEFSSSSKFKDNGLVNKYNLLFKNVNSKSKKSTLYDESVNNKFFSVLQYQSSFPLKKELAKSTDLLTPKISLMLSPNKTKNITNKKRIIGTNNIFSLNRINDNETVEGGTSITVGTSYEKLNKQDSQILKLDLGQSYRFEKDHDLPIASTLGSKSSDIIGSLYIKPNKYLDLEYSFSYDDNFNQSNYDFVKSKINFDKLITSFEYLEEKNERGSENYISYASEYKFNDSGSFELSSRINKKTDLTEFYNLIYNYKNDCLEASLGFNKEYYNDANIKPDKKLFFTLSIKTSNN